MSANDRQDTTVIGKSDEVQLNTISTETIANDVEKLVIQRKSVLCYANYPEPEGIEALDGYQQGGYHPVHLGDEFDNGRYCILHKLGSGGLSTVWLARDAETKSLVALKIMVAMASDEKEKNEARVCAHLKQRVTLKHPAQKHICMFLRSFRMSGPNGTHSCLVYPVTGFNVGRLERTRLRANVVRKVARQLIGTVAYLHSEGICHGDLTASNVTLKLANFDHLSDADLETLLGPAKIEQLEMSNIHEAIPASCPRYVVHPVDLSRIDSTFHTEDMALIDFGEAFFLDDPPSYVGTPDPYRSPSLWFGDPPDISSDLWALGCTLWSLRADMHLISGGFVSLGVYHSVESILSHLGPLPERWKRLYIDLYGVAQPREKIDRRIRRLYRKEHEEERLEPWSEDPPQRPLHVMSHWISDDYYGPMRPQDEEWADDDDYEPQVQIPTEEAQAFGDIIERLLCYEAKDQTPAADLLEHPWLTGSFLENARASDATPLFQSNYPPYSYERRPRCIYYGDCNNAEKSAGES